MTAATFSEIERQPHRDRGGRRSADGYTQALRHTRRVRMLRMAIPIGALLSFAAFIVFPFVNPFRAGGVSVGAIKMDGTRVTMENPRLAGHRKDNKPYEVTATSAVQDIRKPNVVELFTMAARLVNSDDAVINLTARSAIFDSQKEQMILREDVRVRTQSGQEVMLRSADVDFKAGTVRSAEPVIVRFPDMGVTADSLDVSDSGARIAFVGRVRATIDDQDSREAAARKAREGAALRPEAATPRAAGVSPVNLRPSATAPSNTTSSPAAPPRDASGVTIIDPASGRTLPPRTTP